MPVWGGDDPGFLRRAWQSTVVDQTRRPDEVVVVQDGPIGTALDRDPGRAGGRQPGAGAARGPGGTTSVSGRALERGLAACTHDVVARMDADDVSLPRALRRAAAADRGGRRHRGLGAAGVRRRHRAGRGGAHPADRPASGSARQPTSATPSTTRPSSTAVGRPAAGGYQDLPLMEDYLLFARMIATGAAPANVAEPLVYYRVGAGAYARRGGLALLRSEIALQRTFRAQGFTTRREYLRNLVVRGGYRLVPTRLRQVAYRRLIAHRGFGQADSWANGRIGRLMRSPSASGDSCVNTDLVVVGSGLFGLTIAERCARDLGLRVLVLDRRHHIGGNAYCAPDPETGIEVHRYGAHLFHTRTSGSGTTSTASRTFTDYSHRVFTTSAAAVYPMPINLGTINQYFGRRYPRPRPGRWWPSRRPRSTAAHGAEPRGEGHLADRAAALRGVHPRLHRQAVADRPQGAAGRDHQPAAGPLHLRQPLLLRHLRGPADRRLHGLAGADGRRRRIEVRLDTDFFDDARRASSATSRSSTPGRSTATSTTGEGACGWRTLDFEREVVPVGRLPGHPGDELRRRGRPVHPDPRVPALPPGAATTPRTRR